MDIQVEQETNWRAVTENPVDPEVYALVRQQLKAKTETLHGGFIRVTRRLIVCTTITVTFIHIVMVFTFVLACAVVVRLRLNL